ncbi:hypothetical protein MBANPS3_002139 [Mucor bainieri]
MDFQILSKHDDILASYFLDNLYLWFTTVRMNSDPIHATGEQQTAVETIQQIVNRPGSVETSIKIGVKLFSEFPYFKDYVSKLSLKEARYFHLHLKRYLLMFSHQAGFEVSSTKRYTGTMEACILATRDWTAGETVQCCSGAIVNLTKEDDAKLKSEGRDFSVMVSTRKRCTCLFLGPARFMNHDCDANCEFTSPQPNTISFKVQKDICRGEEMTVYYGDHYFGIDNCECRCLSCERMQEGSFRVAKSDSEETEKDDALTPETPKEDENTGNRRSGRVKKEVDYVYKDILSPPKRHRSTPPKPKKEETPISPLPLVEITNEKSLQHTVEGMVIDDPEEMEMSPRAKIQKPFEMDLTFICNEQSPTQCLSNAASPRSQPFTQSTEQADLTCAAHTHMHHMESHGQLLQPSPPTPKQMPPVDPELVGFYEWLDGQSDLSDAEGSIISNVNVATCCSTAKEYKMVITSTGRKLCSRCYRHYKVYGLEWPSRKKPVVLSSPSSPLPPAIPSLPLSVPVPSQPPQPSPSPPPPSALPSPQSKANHKAKDAVKSPPRNKARSQSRSTKPRRAPPSGPRAKLYRDEKQQQQQPSNPSCVPGYESPSHLPAPLGIIAVQQSPPPLPQAPYANPVIEAFVHHSSPTYTLTPLPVSSILTPALVPCSASSPSLRKGSIKRQKVYSAVRRCSI